MREDIFAGRYFRVNSIFAKISSRENISNSLFAKFSSRENKVLYSILTNCDGKSKDTKRPSLVAFGGVSSVAYLVWYGVYVFNITVHFT